MSRSQTTLKLASRAWPAMRPTWLARAGAYLELTKPRIVLLELVTVAVAMQLASPMRVSPWVLMNTVIGAAFVAASAGAFNQWWERASDVRMIRTAGRPLPTGRLTATQVVAFGYVTLVAGVAELTSAIGWRTALVSLATWVIYVFAYTPLKTRSPLNTAVGAVSGALPVLIGWTAVGAAINMQTLALLAVMFLWQFPHFMAIAWLYREDYLRGGQRMLTVVDPTGLRAGAQAVVAALALVPVSLVPALSPQAASPTVYCGWAVLLGIGQMAAAVAFLLRRDDGTARLLLRASLIYMVCWMSLLLLLSTY